MTLLKQYAKMIYLQPPAHALPVLESNKVIPSLAQEPTGELTLAFPGQLQEALQQSQ